MKNRKKVYKCVALSLLICMYPLFAITELETLWDKTKSYSADIKIAEINVHRAEYELQQKNSAYKPSIATSTNSGFNTNYDSIVWYPSAAGNSITVSKPFPGNLVLATAMSYTINRSFLDFFEGGSPENVGYTQAPTFTMRVTQGLCPYWLQKYPNNPYQSELEYSVQENIQSRNQTQKSIIYAVTDAYLQVRKYERLIQMNRKFIAMYDEIIDSLTQSYKDENIEIASIWKQEDNRWYYIESLNDYYDAKNSAIKNLNLYCSSVKRLDFLTELPAETTRLFTFDPQEELVKYKIKELEASYVNQKQNNACTVSFGGSVSENTETATVSEFFEKLKDGASFSWTFTISTDLSNLVSGKNKLLKDNYIKNKKIYEIQQKTIQDEKKQFLLIYDQSMRICTEQLLFAKKMEKDRLQFYKDMKISYLQGDCTKINVLQAESQYFSAKCILENTKDSLWLYTWDKNQIL